MGYCISRLDDKSPDKARGTNRRAMNLDHTTRRSWRRSPAEALWGALSRFAELYSLQETTISVSPKTRFGGRPWLMPNTTAQHDFDTITMYRWVACVRMPSISRDVVLHLKDELLVQYRCAGMLRRWHQGNRSQ